EINRHCDEAVRKILIGRERNAELLTPHEAFQIYNSTYGQDYADKVMQELWQHEDVKEALNELIIKLERITINLFPAMRATAERSLHPACGYDVFYAFVEKGNNLVVKNLGDYR